MMERAAAFLSKAGSEPLTGFRVFSRGAAKECSPGRKPGVLWSAKRERRRRERLTGICRTYGAYSPRPTNPGL